MSVCPRRRAAIRTTIHSGGRSVKSHAVAVGVCAWQTKAAEIEEELKSEEAAQDEETRLKEVCDRLGDPTGLAGERNLGRGMSGVVASTRWGPVGCTGRVPSGWTCVSRVATTGIGAAAQPHGRRFRVTHRRRRSSYAR